MRLRRMLWCRFFHRWHPALYGGGWTRDPCRACENQDYGHERMDRER